MGDDGEAAADPRVKKRRSQRRRRRLPPEFRSDFDAGVLRGDDVLDLAKVFGIEPWYAERRAKRVRGRAERIASAVVSPQVLVSAPEDLNPIEYACSLLGSRVQCLPRGYFLLDHYPVGPKEVVRAANEVLKGKDLPLIPYPGLVPLPAGR